MRKKIGTLLIIGSLGALCAGLAACSNDSEVDKYFKNGNVISVIYDANGGSIAGGTKLIDMFNPESFKADEEGVIKIKLRSPTDPKRPKPTAEGVTVKNGENSLVGWYKTREPDGNGGYTYSDPWDFDTDYVEFNKNEQEKLDFILYAAWIPQYKFEYYYKDKEGKWTQYGTTDFDYLTATEEDKILYVPEWGDSGKMVYTHGDSFTFPSRNNMTFKAAYSDESCSPDTKITEPFVHKGSFDETTVQAKDTVQKIYVEFDEGNHYRISTAKQFVSIADLSGHYTILNDLDFTGEKWSNGFLIGEFNGTITGESAAKPLIFKNVNAEYNVGNEGTAYYGGLFGRVGANAKITNVTFENATLSYKRAVNYSGGSFGFFAGEIDDGATVENVKIGGAMRLWTMRISGGTFNFNLTANGDKRSAVAANGIEIWVCGEKSEDDYYEGKFEFDIDPDSEKGKPKVDKDGNITITQLEDSNKDEIIEKRMKDKQEYKVYGGQ